jgi:hypothetical protein
MKKIKIGNKGECIFDVNAWEKTGTFKELESKTSTDFAKKNIPSQMYVYGTAPACGGEYCDAYKDNKWPIGTTYSGYGHNCWTGSKVVAIDPVAEYQFKEIEEKKKACIAKDEEASKNFGKFIHISILKE